MSKVKTRPPDHLLNQSKSRKMLQISLPSIERDRYLSITGYDMLSVVMRNIEMVGHCNFDTKVTTVITDENTAAEIITIADTIYKFGISAYSPAYMTDFGRGTKYKAINWTDKEDLVAVITYLKKKYGTFFQPEVNEKMTKPGRRRVNCGAGTTRITYGPDGTQRPCAIFPLDFGRGGRIDPALAKAIANIREPNEDICRKCTNINYCRGCMLRGWKKSNELEEECEWAKETNINRLFDEWKMGSIDTSKL